MSWTRLRTWLGDHPRRVTVPAGVIVGLPLMFDAVWSMPFLGLWLVAVVAAAALAFCLACLQVRSGLPLERIWSSVPWVWASCAVTSLVVGILCGADLATAVVLGWLTALPGVFALMGGMELGLHYSRWQIERGRWETIEPDEPLK